jgi:putative nucleotidyltransferase with HDIG domain
MTREDFLILKKWFSRHVAGYYTNEPGYDCIIRLKEQHTKRVCRNMKMLGRKLELTEQEILLAETMALLHDIGRFKQYEIYGTFNDLSSENHASLGLKLIAEHKILSGYTKDEKNFITQAIAFHNAVKLPEDEDKKALFYMRLLRDADKLDIWKIITDYYRSSEKQPKTALQIGLSDSPTCSTKVLEALQKQHIVRIEDLKTLCDFKLFHIGWVYDLNFVPSFQTVQRKGYIEQIEKTLPCQKEIINAVDKAREYVTSFLRASGKR